jgi:hypothetical protein
MALPAHLQRYDGLIDLIVDALVRDIHEQKKPREAGLEPRGADFYKEPQTLGNTTPNRALRRRP